MMIYEYQFHWEQIPNIFLTKNPKVRTKTRIGMLVNTAPGQICVSQNITQSDGPWMRKNDPTCTGLVIHALIWGSHKLSAQVPLSLPYLGNLLVQLEGFKDPELSCSSSHDHSKIKFL